jgi:hypothetical protein
VTLGLMVQYGAEYECRYLRAASVVSKTNMTWAGQTLGNHLGSDGRLRGDLDVQTVTCDITNNVSQIKARSSSSTMTVKIT